MIKQREAKKIYEQIRPKIVLEAEKSPQNDQIIKQLIDKERDPTKRTLLQWLKPELESLLENDTLIISQAKNFTSIIPFERLSTKWLAYFKQSKLPQLNTAPLIESTPLFDAFGKRVGSIGPILFKLSPDPNVGIEFNFQVEKSTKKHQKMPLISINPPKTNSLIEPCRTGNIPKKGLRI